MSQNDEMPGLAEQGRNLVNLLKDVGEDVFAGQKIFPTTAYVGEMNGHARHKEVFYREIYPKYEFPRME